MNQRSADDSGSEWQDSEPLSGHTKLHNSDTNKRIWFERNVSLMLQLFDDRGLIRYPVTLFDSLSDETTPTECDETPMCLLVTLITAHIMAHLYWTREIHLSPAYAFILLTFITATLCDNLDTQCREFVLQSYYKSGSGSIGGPSISTLFVSKCGTLCDKEQYLRDCDIVSALFFTRDVKDSFTLYLQECKTIVSRTRKDCAYYNNILVSMVDLEAYHLIDAPWTPGPTCENELHETCDPVPIVVLFPKYGEYCNSDNVTKQIAMRLFKSLTLTEPGKK